MMWIVVHHCSTQVFQVINGLIVAAMQADDIGHLECELSKIWAGKPIVKTYKINMYSGL